MQDKIKKGLNKKVVLGFLAFLFAVAFICISSFFPFIIDPTRWQTEEFLSDELIIIAITIFGMISFVFISQAQNAQDPRSELAKAKTAFTASVDKITDRGGFKQWVRKVLQKHDREEIKVRNLERYGIEDISVLDLEIAQIKALTEPQRYNGRWYKSLSEEQIKFVLKTRESNPLPNPVDPSYYLVAKSIGENTTISEQSGNESKKKTVLLSWSVLSKIITTLLIAIILGSLVRDLTAEQDTATAWMKFAQRMFSLSTSAFMGFLVGSQMNDIDAYYINLRIEVHKEYLSDKLFKPVSQQEEARQQFIQRVKTENLLTYGKQEEDGNRETEKRV